MDCGIPIGVRKRESVGVRNMPFMRVAPGRSAAVVLAVVMLAGQQSRAAAVRRDRAAGHDRSGDEPACPIERYGGRGRSELRRAGRDSDSRRFARSDRGAVVPGRHGDRPRQLHPRTGRGRVFQSQLAGNWAQTCVYVVPSGHFEKRCSALARLVELVISR